MAVLATQTHKGPDDFGFNRVVYEDGTTVEFNACGHDGREPISGCAFHIRGTSPELFEFVFEVARAGDFVIFNCQGDDSADSPVLILVCLGQESELPRGIVGQYETRPVCESGKMLGNLLFTDFEDWREYRGRVVGG